MSTARDAILRRIGSAPEHEPLLRAYRRGGSLEPHEVTRLFCARVADYRAEVFRLQRADITTAISRAYAGARLAVPAQWPDEIDPGGVELVRDLNLSARELDGLDGVLTGCTLAIAATGTIALTGGLNEGRRALTLVPDLHICLVDAGQIVETVPEAIRLLGSLVRADRRPVTLVSGPSATSDIELSRVEGVHGPRNLRVIVYE